MKISLLIMFLISASAFAKDCEYYFTSTEGIHPSKWVDRHDPYFDYTGNDPFYDSIDQDFYDVTLQDFKSRMVEKGYEYSYNADLEVKIDYVLHTGTILQLFRKSMGTFIKMQSRSEYEEYLKGTQQSGGKKLKSDVIASESRHYKDWRRVVGILKETLPITMDEFFKKLPHCIK